jgi:DNA-directed RNA polymerase specialized sigma24 family protein
VRLQYEQRASRQQIGDELGIGQDGVKSLLRRVRGVLRRCIEGRLAS